MERRKTKFYVRTIIIGIIVLFILIYAGFQARNILLGPKITVLSPLSGSTVFKSKISIEGSTKNIKILTLNDREIVMDETGHFKEELLLPSGYSIMKLQGWDRFKRETTEFIELVYKDDGNK
ncbi:MAG: hypothetical protein WCW14_02590 [Candidatus Paceibacterota bacterium]|jgi:hypothetical protein